MSRRIDIEKFCPRCAKKFAATDDAVNCPDDSVELLPVKQDPLIGVTVADQYEIIEVIGSGGWSVVYRARDIRLQRIVAFKVLRTDLVSTADKIQRFEKEARLASSFSHPHICTIFDYGILPSGQPYLVLEHLSGKSLDRLIREKGTLPVSSLVSLMKQTANALQAAHLRGIVHRDLKPGNIMVVEEQGQELVKVIDFGLAKSYDVKSSDQLTQTGLTIGTPAYMSPEQVKGIDLDGRSDIYSLGCIIYELLTGKQAVGGHSVFETMHNQLEVMPALPESEEIPLPLKTVTLTCLAKDPIDRYQNMRELENDLDSFEKKGKLGARKKNVFAKLRRQRVALPVAVAVFVALLTMAAFKWTANVGTTPAVTVDQTWDNRLPELTRLSIADDMPKAHELANQWVAELKSQGKEHSPEMVKLAKLMHKLSMQGDTLEKRAMALPYITLVREAEKSRFPHGSDEYIRASREAVNSALACDFTKASPYIQDLVASTEAKYGKESKEACEPRYELAWNLFGVLKYAEAEKEYESLAKLAAKYYPPRDNFNVRIWGDMSWLYCNSGKFDKAQAAAEKAIGLMSPVTPIRLRRDSYWTAAGVECKCHKFDKAEAFYREAMALSKTIDTRDVPTILVDMGRCLFAAGKYKEAEPILADSLPRIAKTSTTNSAIYKECLSDYLELLRRTSRPELARAVEAKYGSPLR
jgi:tRNA A-37 threonylcarbamoyl transferase component Bud32/tetratricopeptide (TPR) repeat protein